MPRFPLEFDRISFWLGFLAASLFWWVISRARPMLPVWREQIQQALNLLRQRNYASVEERLRRETLQKAQQMHAASPLFALDEVLIPPRLIRPPAELDSNDDVRTRSVAERVLPYLPDEPELAALLGVPTISAAQALESGRNIVIFGQPGSGKTVCLADLASQLARRQIKTRGLNNALPILIHAIDLASSAASNENSLETLLRCAVLRGNALVQKQYQRLVKIVVHDSHRRVVVVVDGLDELPPGALPLTVEFLTRLAEQYPRIQMIAAGSPGALGDLTRAAFFPVGIAGWGPSQRAAFTKKWSTMWSSEVQPGISNQVKGSEVDPAMLEGWIASEGALTSPLEWTLRVWGAFSGDLYGNSPLAIFSTAISRYLPDASLMPALRQAAHQMVEKEQISLSFDALEKALSKGRRSSPLEEAGSEPDPTGANSQLRDKRGKDGAKVSASLGAQIIDALLSGGLLVEHSNSQIRFSSPVFLGFLAGPQMNREQAAAAAQNIRWSVNRTALQFAAACDETPGWINIFLQEPDPPLLDRVLLPARWLREAPQETEWRSRLMRLLVQWIQQERGMPFSTRLRITSAFLLSRDPSISKLFRQLLGSKNTEVRRCALIGLGALGQQQFTSDLLPMLADNDSLVRGTACLALGANPAETATNAVIDVLLSGDEDSRQAAAETLAHNPADGHRVLREAMADGDILVRRAAVFGLMQVGETWSREALEKMAIEDGQWVVRNAAGHALDALQQEFSGVPEMLPPPSESPWLLTFASKQGKGILPGQPATDLLLDALRSGSPDDQKAAMLYLRNEADEKAITELLAMIDAEDTELRDAADRALRWLALSGVDLPAGGKYSPR